MSEAARPRQVLTPSQLNALARSLLEDAFPLVWLEGELGNLSRPASGHLYFTLKDAQAQVRCALFRTHRQRLAFAPAEGMQVLARGRLTLYEARGDYQLIVEHLEPAGDGALRRALEQLKTRLAAEGLFAAERKRPLPRFVRRLALLTSPSGAAVRDVLHVLERRFPLLPVDLLPVPVQGETAAAQIVATLERVYAAGRHDLVLLTRGGGSLEDLWAFNDENLVRALAAAPVPTVSAIGHEIDFSLCDLAADLRAATPSAAAELIVPDRLALRREVAQQRRRLTRAWERRRGNAQQRLDQAWLRLHAQRPQTRLARSRERGQGLRQQLDRALRQHLQQARVRAHALLRALAAQAPQQRLGRERQRLLATNRRLRQGWATAERQRRQQTQALARALAAVSPLATLQRGYAILQREDDGMVVRSAAQASEGERLRARLAEGELRLAVLPPPDGSFA